MKCELAGGEPRLRLPRLIAFAIVLAYFPFPLWAQAPLKQICQGTIAQGILWDSKSWSPSSFVMDTFVLEDRPIDNCFKFGAPSELPRLKEEAEFLNRESLFDSFGNHEVQCIAMIKLGTSTEDTFACIRRERNSDGQVSYDCKGLGWELLNIAPNLGFHLSRITGAIDPSLDEKPPMFVSAGKCSSIK